jgi:N6-L-threonylcarbamoyladenine synthase
MARFGNYDSSLSGLKTAVLRRIRAEREAGRKVDSADLAASLQETVVDVQVSKTLQAAADRRVETILLGGRVVANSRLRGRIEEAGAEARLRVLIPSVDLCTGNTAMIALAGAWRLERGERSSLGIGADPSMELG